MGALAAAISKDGGDVVPKVVRMLDELKHRGSDAHGIATMSSVTIARSIEDLKTRRMWSDIVIGHNLNRVIPSDKEQPIQHREIAIVFEGRLFPPLDGCEVLEVAEKIGKNPEDEAGHLIRDWDGSYVFALLHRNHIIAGRDALGTVPLYCGENDETYALASERKTLWALNMENVKSFPPGSLALISREGLSFQPVKTVVKPSERYVTMDGSLGELRSLLSESIRERIIGLKEVALAFSGGLDSSIIASMVKECEMKVQLVTVGLEGQSEVEHAEEVAGTLGLPIKVEIFNADDIERILPRVLWLIEEPNALNASIAIPIFWVAESAAKSGCKVLLAGQGSDELFGGYSRYLRDYKRFGIRGVEDAIYHDVITSYEVNFQRDDKVCAFHKLELRLPYADRDLVLFSLSLPLELKIRSMADPLRKRVLRLLAKDIGLPRSVYERPKRAVQYATGVDKVLRRLARREKLNLREFINRSFRKVYSLEDI